MGFAVEGEGAGEAVARESSNFELDDIGPRRGLAALGVAVDRVCGLEGFASDIDVTPSGTNVGSSSSSSRIPREGQEDTGMVSK